MEKSIDYKLIENKDYESLWKKYKPLCMKYFQKLPEDIRKQVYDDYFEDFYVDCYEVLHNAAESLKLSKIKNPKTWTFYIQLAHYLQNFTTRDIVRDTYKQWANETSVDEFNSSDDGASERNEYYISNDYKEYDILRNDLEGDEKLAVEMRLSGKSWEEVRKALGIRCIDFRAFQNALREKILTYIDYKNQTF